MYTITSLKHPTMIAKIRQCLKDAALGKGVLHDGHGKRVYVKNRKGENIFRIDYKGASKGGFIAYGGADWGQTDITDIVKQVLREANPFNPTLSQDAWKFEAVERYRERLNK